MLRFLAPARKLRENACRGAELDRAQVRRGGEADAYFQMELALTHAPTAQSRGFHFANLDLQCTRFKGLGRDCVFLFFVPVRMRWDSDSLTVPLPVRHAAGLATKLHPATT